MSIESDEAGPRMADRRSVGEDDEDAMAVVP
jgi:hypothetical protein